MERTVGSLAAGVVWAGVAAPACASSGDAEMACFVLTGLILVWAALHLLAFVVMAPFGAYRSARVAWSHTCLAVSGPVFGAILLAEQATSGSPDFDMGFVYCDALLFVLACLPLAVHALHRRRAARRNRSPQA